jgi:hypothetical protein
MIGNKYWKWTIISFAGRSKDNRELFTAQCECGTQKTGKKDYFVSGVSKQCQKCFRNRTNIYKVGDRIHDWTILEEKPNNWSERCYLCLCICGQERIVRKRDLERNKSKRCRSCHIARKNTTHNSSKSPTYKTWVAMKSRCLNRNNKGYRYYGGRGISFCDKWKDYRSFLKDVGPKPEGKTLDRIDPDGQYEPGNVRWVTPEENHQNRRNSEKYSHLYAYIKKEDLCAECLKKFTVLFKKYVED